jgi:Flp pilus assembly protein TadG
MCGEKTMKMMSDERGYVTVFMAVFMGLVMLGFLAFALDVGYLFHEKRMAQAAADAAAVAAAEELSIGGAAEQNAANVAATKNGFDTTLTTNFATVTLSQKDTGNYSNANGASAPANWVQAVVSQPIHTFFLGAFNKNMSTMTVSASAMAGVSAANSTCVCLLGASGTDLDMSNNAQLAAGTTCAITADSTSSNAITVVGSANVCASSVGTVSTTWDYSTGLYGNGPNINNGGSICAAATKVTGASPCASTLVQPTKPSGLPCVTNPIPTYSYALAANTYCSSNYNSCFSLPMSGAQYMSNGTVKSITNDTVVSNSVCYNSLDMSASSQVHFASGTTYYINGDFTTGGGTKLYGTGVTFVVTGNVNIANGTTANLSAPTTNGVSGTLFYVGGTSVDFEGGSGTTLTGTVSAPAATVKLGNGTTTAIMDIVAQKLVMNGGAKLTTYSNPALGAAGSGTPALSQ